jgi:hypothetical protein
MRVEDVNWTGLPTDGRGPWLPILRPKPRSAVRGLIVCPQLVAAETHWINDHDHPCTRKTGACEGCELHLPIRWNGYLGCWSEAPESSYFLLAVTREAAHSAKAVLGCPGRSLRGLVVKAIRTGKANNSPVRLEFSRCEMAGNLIPEEFDIKEALLRLWQGDTIPGPATAIEGALEKPADHAPPLNILPT